MTETPTERAARVHYVHQAVTRDNFTEKQALANWEYCPEADNWRALRVQAMAVAIRVYREAVAQVSAAKRERATDEAAEKVLDWVGNLLLPADAHKMANDIITTYERVMAEPAAPQPRKEGA